VDSSAETVFQQNCLKVGMMGKFNDVDAYVSGLGELSRVVAEQVRALVRNVVPDATETIKYDMPAYQLGGRSFIYFAVWKKHVGLYPIYRGEFEFEELVAPYRAKKDTLQFALDTPLPLELIERVILAQAKHGK
jgi:uncharacterized protein YdhG (YjbR/CyaY superfamily)